VVCQWNPLEHISELSARAPLHVVGVPQSLRALGDTILIVSKTLMSKRKTTQKRTGAKKSVTRPRPPQWSMPPSYKAQAVRNWKVRMDVTANAAVQTLTAAQLASVVGIIATSATTSVFMSDSYRLRRVSLWSWTATQGTTVDIMLKFPDSGNSAGQGGPPCVVLDSSASMDRPAYVTLKPPRTSAQNLWQDCSASNTAPVLSYLSPQLAIMDLEFEFIIDDLGVIVAGPAIGGATLGTIYHHSVATLQVVTPLNRI